MERNGNEQASFPITMACDLQSGSFQDLMDCIFRNMNIFIACLATYTYSFDVWQQIHVHFISTYSFNVWQDDHIWCMSWQKHVYVQSNVHMRTNKYECFSHVLVMPLRSKTIAYSSNEAHQTYARTNSYIFTAHHLRKLYTYIRGIVSPRTYMHQTWQNVLHIFLTAHHLRKCVSIRKFVSTYRGLVVSCDLHASDLTKHVIHHTEIPTIIDPVALGYFLVALGSIIVGISVLHTKHVTLNLL